MVDAGWSSGFAGCGSDGLRSMPGETERRFLDPERLFRRAERLSDAHYLLFISCLRCATGCRWRFRFRERLEFAKARVVAAPGGQLGVCAQFNDPPRVQNNNAVGEADGGQTVRDD